MSTFAVLTPVDLTPGRRGGGLWRKQILKKGTIDYEGRPITFDDAYLDDLVRAFEERALDQVPLQFADASNAHTDDPERTRGEIVALERTDDGLDALVRLSEAGEATVADNPGLSVSARILEDHRRVDGKHWPRAIAHVLATLNPRLTGMRPWTQVALAGPEIPVVDLSAATYQTGGRMAELTDEQVAALLALLPTEPPTSSATDPSADDGDLTDAEWQAILDAAAADDEPSGDPSIPEPALAGAALSNAALAAIDLANAQAAAASQAVTQLQAENARIAWGAERDRYLADGVPPALLDLAGQVINPPVDLANGAPAPAAVVRQILDMAKGSIDFGVIGSSQPTDPQAESAQLARAFINQFGA